MTLAELKALFPVRSYSWLAKNGYINVAKCVCGNPLKPIFRTIKDTHIRHALLYSEFIFEKRRSLKNGQVVVDYWTGRFGGWKLDLENGVTSKPNASLLPMYRMVSHAQFPIWDAEAPQESFLCGKCNAKEDAEQKILAVLRETVKQITEQVGSALNDVTDFLLEYNGLNYSCFLYQNSAIEGCLHSDSELRSLRNYLPYGLRRKPIADIVAKLRTTGLTHVNESWPVFSSRHALNTKQLYHPSVFNLEPK